MTFKIMFDVNIPVKVVKALQTIIPFWYAGHSIGYLKDHTDKFTVADTVWVPRLAAGGWILLAADRGKSNKGVKLPRLCRQHRLTHILIGKSIHDLHDVPKLCAFLSMWDAIAATASVQPGTHYRFFMQHERLELVRVTYEETSDGTTSSPSPVRSI